MFCVRIYVSDDYASNFVCTANAMPQNQSSGWFWFEFADAAWKAPLGGVEPYVLVTFSVRIRSNARVSYWGLFDKDRNFKPLTIPTCLANAAVLPPLPSGVHTLPPVGTATGTDTTGGPKPTGGAASGSEVVLGSLALTMAAAIASLVL